MTPSKRVSFLLALITVIPMTLACGGGEPEVPPAEDPAADETPAATAEPAPEPAPVEPVPEPETQPEEPQIVGNILLSRADFDYGEVTREEAPYEWWVTIRNDTTSTLRITVYFDFVDTDGKLVKREEKTVRLDPASRTNIRESGSMTWDDANRVDGFITDYTYEIATT